VLSCFLKVSPIHPRHWFSNGETNALKVYTPISRNCHTAMWRTWRLSQWPHPVYPHWGWLEHVKKKHIWFWTTQIIARTQQSNAGFTRKKTTFLAVKQNIKPTLLLVKPAFFLLQAPVFPGFTAQPACQTPTRRCPSGSGHGSYCSGASPKPWRPGEGPGWWPEYSTLDMNRW